MLRLFGSMVAIMLSIGQVAVVQAKDIKSTYDVKKFEIRLDDGWRAVISMKTALVLDTIVGEPKIMCAGTWQFQYALHSTIGRYDSDNLPQSVIDDISLFNVDILYDVGHTDSLVIAHIPCDPGVFYKSGSKKPSFNVAASSSWDKTMVWDYYEGNPGTYFYDEEATKDHMRFLKTNGRIGHWEDNGSGVLNASINLWPIRYYILAKERETEAKRLKVKKNKLEAERKVIRDAAQTKKENAKRRSEEAKKAIADKGDLSEDVFDDFFAEDEEPEEEDVELRIASVNPQLDREVKRLSFRLSNIDKKIEKVRAAHYRFSSNITSKHEGLGTYCAPEEGLSSMHKISHYMLAYAKCIGTEKPVPRSFEIINKISLDEDDFNGSDDMDGVGTYPFGLWVEMDKDSWSGSHYLWLKSGKVLTMNDVFEGEVETRFYASIQTLPDGDFVIYSNDRPPTERLRNVIHRFDSNAKRVARYNLFDLDEAEYFTDSGSWNSTFSHSLETWPGPNGELIVEWSPGQYSVKPKVRAVFSRNGEIIHQDKAKFIGSRGEGAWADFDEEKWSRESTSAKLSEKRSLPLKFDWRATRKAKSLDGITLSRGEKKYYIDLSHLDFDAMLPEDYEHKKALGFNYSIDPKTHEIMMVPRRCSYCDEKNDIKVYILKPIY